MNRVVLIGATLAMGFGIALIIPALHQGPSRESLVGITAMVVSLGIIFIAGGGAAGVWAWRHSRGDSVPAPVRASMMALIVFLAFCGLEFSDGLLRQGGRVFYWTSVAFLPALGLLYGLVFARRWAWWIARIMAALAVLWFVAFIIILPGADLRTDGVPVPWQGRLYMAAVSLLFASIAAYAFRSLGLSEARMYFETKKPLPRPTIYY